MRRQHGRSSGQAQAPCDWGHKGGPDKKQSPAYALEGEEAGARICRALSILSEMKAVGSFQSGERASVSGEKPALASGGEQSQAWT